MKTVIRFFQVLAVICMLTGCDSCEKPLNSHPQRASIPFNATFSTTFSKNVIPEGHIDLKGTVLQMEQTGTGTDDEIGIFRINLSCYWSITDCVPGRSGGTLADGLGNKIYIKCKECFTAGDLTADFPADQAHITGKFEFEGGTGLFEGVTGEGIIDAYVINDGKFAAIYHHWQGNFKSPNW